MSKKPSPLFEILQNGFDALAAERAGKVTLRKTQAALLDPVEVSADEIKAVRESSHASQAVMAHRLRTNPRTYQNWEQGKAKPNAQAALLIKLVKKYPDMVERLESL
ncbi:DNA-binding transcriptional regulator [Paraburkholderia jirisanensis]|jgi:putative transcriptional regulator